MASKKLFFITALFVLGLSFVFAQEEETDPNVNYYIDRSEREPRFVQRLIWDEAEFVLRYVVTVQRRDDNGVFRDIERIVTDVNFAEVSLPVGHYRYNIELFDLFDEYALTTRWREFEIIRAVQPALTGFSPSAFYLDEDDVWEITVRGRNFLPESVIYLVEGTRIIRPIRYTADGNSAHLVFSGVSLSTGRYEIYIRNPGGLDARTGTFTIGNKKPFDLNLSFGYTPLVPLHGFMFQDTSLEAPFPADIFFLGAGLKIAFIPFKRVWGTLGAELSAAFTYLTHEHETYSPNAFLLDTHLSFQYQYYFIRKVFAVNLSLGIGVSSLFGFQYEYPMGPAYDEIPVNVMPSAVASLSFMVFVSYPFYINFGTDFVQIFSVDTPMPGYLRPFLAAGIQF